MTNNRPILGADKVAPASPTAKPALPAAADMPMAKELPAWDLLPSDLLLVRRRAAKK